MMEYEGYPIVNERLIPESELRDKDARVAALEAENERLQLKLRNVRLWLDSVGFAGSPSAKLTACTQRDLWRLSLIASPKQDTAAMETTP